MRFLHLATALQGGAGIAAIRLHQALREAGHASRVLTHRGSDPATNAFAIGTTYSRVSNAVSKAWYMALSREKYYFRDEAWCIPDIKNLKAEASSFAPDVIVAHFITGFVDFEAIAHLHEVTKAPVIFHLMDMAPLTGGCHFAWECSRYANGCGKCPALFVASESDKSARVAKAKVRALAEMRHCVITGASRLSEQAGLSHVFASSAIHTIPLAIDGELFRPRDQASLRQKFGIDSGRQIIFFGSRNREQQRKGVQVLKEALAALPARMGKGTLPALLVAGDGPDFQEFSGAGFTVRSIGSVSLDVLAECYAVADIFVSPSIEDSGPMMINEAVMSGCPVACFDIGVARDLIVNGETGFLASPIGSAPAMADGIVEMLGWPHEQHLRARSKLRTTGCARLAPAVQAAAFVGAAENILGSC